MDLWIKGADIVTPDRTISDHIIVISDGRIVAVEPADQVTDQPAGVKIVAAAGYLVTAGFIDLHVHGGNGSDAMDAEPSAVQNMSSFILSHGVTTYLPTTMTGSPAAIDRAIETVSAFRAQKAGAQPYGVHLEGPYLDRTYCGAQPTQWLRVPDPAEYRRWFSTGIVRRMTIAPELPGAFELIRAGVQEGISFSAGHTQASYAQVEQAVDLGLNQITHTFNGMVGLHHREPGVVGAALTDERLFCEIIADGHHVHPAVIELLVRAKGPDHTLLVTDAMRAAGLADGAYDLGGQATVVQSGIARTSTGGLAGSTLTLDQAVRNIITLAGVSLNAAVAMATSTPAQVLGLTGRKGVIQPSADADLVIMDSELKVVAVIAAGQIVYQTKHLEQDEDHNDGS